VAVANATGAGATEATAAATMQSAIVQHASANGTHTTPTTGGGTTIVHGNASDTLTNNGTLNIHANADANANGGAASAVADMTSVIKQSASATGGNASATITNDGTIDIGAIAHATGDVQAFAQVDGGIGQGVLAGVTATSEGGSSSSSSGLFAAPNAVVTGPVASASLVNNGTINVHATASAHDTVGGNASATGMATHGVQQGASATAGDATVSITGTGSITVTAFAKAVSTGAVINGSAAALASV